MTIQTIKGAKVSCGGVTFVAFSPCIFMFTTVNREILSIVVKSAWFPGSLAVASSTIGRESCRCMIRSGRVVISRMAAIAGSRCGANVARFVTCCTIRGNGGVGTL